MIFTSLICFLQYLYKNRPKYNLYLQGICIPPHYVQIPSVATVLSPVIPALMEVLSH